MEINRFEATLLDNDINLVSDDLQFTTNADIYGLQSDVPKETSDFNRVIILCNEIRKMLLEIKKILNKYKNIK